MPQAAPALGTNLPPEFHQFLEPIIMIVMFRVARLHFTWLPADCGGGCNAIQPGSTLLSRNVFPAENTICSKTDRRSRAKNPRHPKRLVKPLVYQIPDMRWECARNRGWCIYFMPPGGL